MPRMIDVTGLSQEAVRAVESIVNMLREKAASPPPSVSVFELFGKAPNPRSGDEIARQVQEEHDAWGEP